MADNLAASPSNPYLKRIADFLRFIQQEDKPEFLPSEASPLTLAGKYLLPQSTTVENLAYGNYPMAIAPQGTGSLIPIAKTGRKAEIADILGFALGGVPGTKVAGEAVTTGSNKLADLLTQAVTRNPEMTAPMALRQAEGMLPLARIAEPPQAQKSPLGFFSRLEEATIPLQNKGTGSQYLAQLEKTPGVKPEELEWTGLSDFLKSKQTVTKPEIQDYLAANRVDLQEVRLEDSIKYPYKTADEWQNAIFRAERAGNWDEVNRLNDAWYTSEGVGNAGTTKFSSYTIPGGENYREILLTLPTDATRLRAEGDRISRLANPTPEEIETFRRANVAGANEFRSSHFDQPNILAHMRVNDRVVNGKNTLFIEEIQSDWHQAGRKKGYKIKNAFDIVEASPGRFVINNKSDGSRVEFADGTVAFATREAAQRTIDSGEVLRGLGAKGGVPDAPFKTTWHELALKRAIQEASEKGYDRIAFTTGKTQAERYDLSKQVDKIEVNFNRNLSSGKEQRVVNVTIPDQQILKFRVNDDGIIDWSNTATDYKGKSLDDLIGKEMAQKIVETKEPKVFSGVDLQIGGEGMKGFYDLILPKSLDKLGKKFDTKVTKTNMDGTEVWSMDITPKMRESILKKGQPLFAAAPVGMMGQEQENDPLTKFLGMQEPANDPLMQFLGYK